MGKSPGCCPWRHGCTKSPADTGAWASSLLSKVCFSDPLHPALGVARPSLVRSSRRQALLQRLRVPERAWVSFAACGQGLGVPGEKGRRGLPCVPPECGARRRGAAQTLLPSPVAHLCPPRPVLPAELTPPLLLLSALASAPIPSASSLCGQGRGWLSGVVVGELGGQPSCISRTSLPYPHPDSHLGLRSSKGPHTSRPQTRTGVPWASAFGLTQPRGARKSLGVHCDSGQG